MRFVRLCSLEDTIVPLVHGDADSTEAPNRLRLLFGAGPGMRGWRIGSSPRLPKGRLNLDPRRMEVALSLLAWGSANLNPPIPGHA